MSHIPKVMNALARLLTYPDEHTTQGAELLFVVLQSEIPEAASAIAQFGSFLEQHESAEVEEAFTRTFDVNPTCALEVGWHLFGEEYARGMFLVRMREELRKYGLSETHELPDHISHVLSVVAAMPESEAARFVRACVQPAVKKMHDALENKDTPYRDVVGCLAEVIKQKWGEAATTAQDVLESRPPETDLLHAFPVADVGCGEGCSGSCSDDPEVVSLDTSSLLRIRPEN